MRGHLTDTELAEALGDEPRDEALAHLGDCPTCRAERDRLRTALTGLAEQARIQAERPDAAWERQRRQIGGRLDDRPARSPSWRWVWAPAALGLAALTVVWLGWETPRQSQEPEIDHAILAAVERSLQADVPMALRPVALLAAEIERRGTATE